MLTRLLDGAEEPCPPATIATLTRMGHHDAQLVGRSASAARGALVRRDLAELRSAVAQLAGATVFINPMG